MTSANTSTRPAPRFRLRDIATLLGLRAAYRLGSRLRPARTVAHAATLFQTPLPSSRTRAAAALPVTRARRETLDVNGEAIASYVWGDPARQPYVLLVHGWSSFGLRFEAWAARLQALGFAAVAFDQPGHGCSAGTLCTLPDFARTAAAVGRHYGNAHAVIAHSLGGAAVTLALGDGWSAERVVLIAPAADPEAATRRFARFVRLADRLRPELHRLLAERTQVAIEDLHVSLHAPRRHQKVMIVHDAKDRDVPLAEGELYESLWPGARLVRTTGLGHRKIVEDGDVVALIISFVSAAD
ncbi:pimeloyl-ACP methyl ester carboxylesterase [Luteibacter sp. Sphag1AF]|uniref:alpha/beta hydrolase n=1 Tax=Luteibacter sp. Sphag1AF TaxID=2587031 RepID=UPI001608D7DA|nr:alpha/beta fold hydrolase [Luteibacter sp. Sphag1AF]MBB3227253.1 pimeloyl-ACP methyl ester carboxylesterase [Luteibacter sp. Sphag1AF]